MNPNNVYDLRWKLCLSSGERLQKSIFIKEKTFRATQKDQKTLHLL